MKPNPTWVHIAACCDITLSNNSELIDMCRLSSLHKRHIGYDLKSLKTAPKDNTFSNILEISRKVKPSETRLRYRRNRSSRVNCTILFRFSSTYLQPLLKLISDTPVHWSRCSRHVSANLSSFRKHKKLRAIITTCR